jgi:hypothetical protein
MTPTSRPLRALGVLLGGWTAARVVALWPVAGAAIEAPSTDAARVATALPVVAIPLDNDVPLFAKRPLSARGMKVLRQAHGAAAAIPVMALAVTPSVPDQRHIGVRVSNADPPAAFSGVSAPGLPATGPIFRLGLGIDAGGWRAVAGEWWAIGRQPDRHAAVLYARP